MDDYKKVFLDSVVAPTGQALLAGILTLFTTFILTQRAFLGGFARFIGCCGIYGFFQLFIINPSVPFVKFNIGTISFLAASYLFAQTFNYIYGWNMQKTLKIIILMWFLVCFRSFKKNDDIMRYLFQYIALSVKLLCASEDMEKPIIIKKDEAPLTNVPKVTKLYFLICYLFYTSWISYDDFVNLFLANRKQSYIPWKRTVIWAFLQLIVFRIISHNIIKKDLIGNFALKYELHLLIVAFQYRCDYYYHAKKNELQLLALCIEHPEEWPSTNMFNFFKAETSTYANRSFIQCNLPLGGYMYSRFITAEPDSVKIFQEAISIFVAVSTYSPYYSVLLTLCVICAFLQQLIIEAMYEDFNVCLLTCTGPRCFHSYGRRSTGYYLFYCALIIYNHFLISLFFVDSIEEIFSSTKTLGLLFVIEMVVLILIGYIISRRPKPERYYDPIIRR